jgi:hypothetical protein
VKNSEFNIGTYFIIIDCKEKHLIRLLDINQSKFLKKRMSPLSKLQCCDIDKYFISVNII